MMLFHRLNTLVLVAGVEKKWKDTIRDFGGLYVRVLRGATVGVIGLV